MARRTKKTRPCKECGPVADFVLDSDWDDNAGKYVECWKCTNCGGSTPCGKPPVHTKVSKAQQDLIDYVTAGFGGTVEVGEICQHTGRVWVSFKNNERSIYDASLMFGSIGARGAFKFHIHPLFQSEKVLRTRTQLNIYALHNTVK